MTISRKLLEKGAHGFALCDDDMKFLTPDSNGGTDPFQHTPVGRDPRWDDSPGTRDLAGYGVDGADGNAAFLRPSSVGPDIDRAHQNLGSIVDSDDGMGSGNKLTGGGGPIPQSHDVGEGKPRFASKAGNKVQNWDSKGGRDRTGGR
jgi:hypothetical protein